MSLEATSAALADRMSSPRNAAAAFLVDAIGYGAYDVGPLAEGWRHQRDTVAYGVHVDPGRGFAGAARHVTPEVMARAFDPFFTTKPIGQGTGLGLSMIHGFAHQSGGQVRIRSTVGRGTTLCLYLPRHRGATPEAEAPARPEAQDSGDGETILVIDDEPTVRMLVIEVLQENGYRVLEATDGPAGLKILQSAARIDLLITDVGLPGGLNGRQVADAARLVRRGLKVLFITGYADSAALGAASLEPGMEVITKPFVMATLGTKVRDLLERRGL